VGAVVQPVRGGAVELAARQTEHLEITRCNLAPLDLLDPRGGSERTLVQVDPDLDGNPVRVRHGDRVLLSRRVVHVADGGIVEVSGIELAADVAAQLARDLAGVATVALEALLALRFELTLHVVIPAAAFGVADLDDVRAATDVAVLALGAAPVVGTTHDAAALLVAGQPLGLAVLLLDLDELLVR
jgi:hypothetical protein